MTFISEDKYYQDLVKLATLLKDNTYDGIYGIPRGGLIPAAFLAAELHLPLVSKDQLTDATLVVDDLVDSGTTLSSFSQDKAVLYYKSHSPAVMYAVDRIDGWIEFWYEETQSDVEDNVRRILEYMGEDPTREGLAETPKRYIKFLKEFMSPAQFNFTTFDGEQYDEMIIQKDVPFFSLCEHHMAPFWGYASIAYLPNEKIVGLSKLARTVEIYSRRLQNQERITRQIAERLDKELSPKGVAVQLRARHLCMEMRGVRTHDVYTVTNKLTGAFRDEADTRAEFFNAL